MSGRVAVKQRKISVSGPRHFLNLSDLDSATLRGIIAEARRRKNARAGLPRGMADRDAPLKGHMLAMIFDRPSTRTRISFDVGMQQLGGQSINLAGADTQLGRGETIADTARVLSRYVDAIMLRTLAHESLQGLAENSGVPVINGLTKSSHPCQVMADVMTFEETKGSIRGRTIAWSGDCNNVCASWIHAAASGTCTCRSGSTSPRSSPSRCSTYSLLISHSNYNRNLTTASGAGVSRLCLTPILVRFILLPIPPFPANGLPS